MNRVFGFLVSMLLLIGHVGYADSISEERLRTSARPLYFSLIPKKNLDQQIDELRPLFDLLEEQLNRPIEIIRPQSYQSVIEGLVSHAIDFCVLGPASYAYARQRDHQVEAFASFMMNTGYVTQQGEYYSSILITRRASGLATVAALRGKTIALTDPASTSGSLIPTLEFSKSVGSPLSTFFAKQVYTGAHDRSIDAVVAGQVDAAFVASSRLDDKIRDGQAVLHQFNVLWTSEPIHYDPFVFGGSLDDTMREKIREVFFSTDSRLDQVYENMRVKGLVSVEDKDYQPIHDIVAQEM